MTFSETAITDVVIDASNETESIGGVAAPTLKDALMAVSYTHLALADLEVIVGLIVEHGNSQTAKAEVDRTLDLVDGADSSACFHVVGGADDSHAGQAAHEGEVLAALVGSAVLTDGDAAVGSADLHVQVRCV